MPPFGLLVEEGVDAFDRGHCHGVHSQHPGRCPQEKRERSFLDRQRTCANWVRELTPSLRKTLTRWYSTVLALTKSCAAISWFLRPCAARRATWASRGVSCDCVSTLRLRARSPVASSSPRARSANARNSIDENMSYAARSWSRASRLRPWRRSHSPYSRWDRPSSGFVGDWPS